MILAKFSDIVSLKYRENHENAENQLEWLTFNYGGLQELALVRRSEREFVPLNVDYAERQVSALAARASARGERQPAVSAVVPPS